MFVPSDESAYEDEDFGVSGLDFSPEIGKILQY